MLPKMCGDCSFWAPLKRSHAAPPAGAHARPRTASGPPGMGCLKVGQVFAQSIRSSSCFSSERTSLSARSRSALNFFSRRCCLGSDRSADSTNSESCLSQYSLRFRQCSRETRNWWTRSTSFSVPATLFHRRVSSNLSVSCSAFVSLRRKDRYPLCRCGRSIGASSSPPCGSSRGSPRVIRQGGSRHGRPNHSACEPQHGRVARRVEPSEMTTVATLSA